MVFFEGSASVLISFGLAVFICLLSNPAITVGENAQALSAFRVDGIDRSFQFTAASILVVGSTYKLSCTYI